MAGAASILLYSARVSTRRKRSGREGSKCVTRFSNDIDTREMSSRVEHPGETIRSFWAIVSVLHPFMLIT